MAPRQPPTSLCRRADGREAIRLASGERFVGVRRCESCNLFCAALGPGGACPDCDRPVLVDDLLGEGVFTRA